MKHLTSACLSLASIVSAAAIQASPVTGVYTIYVERSGKVDETHMVVDQQNKIRAYNYLGDEYDNGPNCYRLANRNTDINYFLDNNTINYYKSINAYATSVMSHDLANFYYFEFRWPLNEAGQIESLQVYSLMEDKLYTLDGPVAVYIPGGMMAATPWKSTVNPSDILGNLCS